MSSILLQRLVIPEYITQVKMTEKRRPRYYKKLEDLPGNWKRERFYVKSNKVYRRLDDKPVIKNSRAVGTERYETLNGNKFWAGYGNPHTRAKLARAIKQDFTPHVKKQLKPFSPSDLPLGVSWEVHRVIGTAPWFDLSNMWFYYKMIEDVLVDCGIIPDDNIMFITKLAGPSLVPIKDERNRKLVVSFYREGRPEIIRHPTWR